jgi:Ca2+-binding RTX toxin-like protein
MAIVEGSNLSETLDWLDGVTGGADTIYGYGGEDWLWGKGGNDILVGGAGPDHLMGGSGTDEATYFDSNVAVSVYLETGYTSGGTAEGDTFDSVENLTGSQYGDHFRGDNGPNTLYGWHGDDHLVGLGGADYLAGGYGWDTIAYANSPTGVVISLMDGLGWGGHAEGDTYSSIEEAIGSNHDDIIWGNGGNNELQGIHGSDVLKGFGGADRLRGGEHTDQLYGMDGEDRLYGDGGSDTLDGGDNDDFLDGGTGFDVMIGGWGDDIYIVDHSSDAVSEAGGQGIENVMTSVSWTLTAGADVEILGTTQGTGLSNIDLTGNSSHNVIYGNYGNNVINGGDGNDMLTGLNGQDSFLFNTSLNAATNVDEIMDFNVADDTIRLDQDIFSSNLGLGNISAGEFLIGAAAQDANDRIIYNSATGALSYDSDGVGGAAAIQFAEVTPGLGLTHLDFLVV